jgi:hypothetical protein
MAEIHKNKPSEDPSDSIECLESDNLRSPNHSTQALDDFAELLKKLSESTWFCEAAEA